MKSKGNQGLLEPIIVRNGDCVVLEGNSRLAAYRILKIEDPITWSKIDCKILSSDISEEFIFILLGNFHITGKKDWEPFETAGYLYRRKTSHNISLSQLESEVGLTKGNKSSY